jgi:hypothetical protein
MIHQRAIFGDEFSVTLRYSKTDQGAISGDYDDFAYHLLNAHLFLHMVK